MLSFSCSTHRGFLANRGVLGFGVTEPRESIWDPRMIHLSRRDLNLGFRGLGLAPPAGVSGLGELLSGCKFFFPDRVFFFAPSYMPTDFDLRDQ